MAEYLAHQIAPLFSVDPSSGLTPMWLRRLAASAFIGGMMGATLLTKFVTTWAINHFKAARSRLLPGEHLRFWGWNLSIACIWLCKLAYIVAIAGLYFWLWGFAQERAAIIADLAHSVRHLSEGDSKIVQACAEDHMPKMRARTFDLVFSSPPFFDTEYYSDDSTQSVIRYPEYVRWVDGFLRVIIAQAHRLLRSKGFFVINVTALKRWPFDKDAESIASKLFGPPVRVLRMTMHTRPVQRANGFQMSRFEPILVFQKS